MKFGKSKKRKRGKKKKKVGEASEWRPSTVRDFKPKKENINRKYQKVVKIIETKNLKQ